MKKNNKGFTLVELLAVIVVLAIIMVIATQQINKTINRSRAKSFSETMNIVEENARILFTEGGLELVEDELESSLDFNKNDYYISLNVKSGEYVSITLAATTGGKFKNITWDDDLANENRNPNFIYEYETNKEGIKFPVIYTTIYSSGEVNH